MTLQPQKITCDHCASINPAGQARCIACGAPLSVPVTPPIYVTRVDAEAVAAPVSLSESRVASPPIDTQSVSQQLKEGTAVVGSSLGVLGIGGLILRTVAEAVAIAFSAYIIGMYAGIADITLRGPALYLLIALGGGGLLGLCVGLVTKRTIFTLLSAPVGTILGSFAAVLLSLKTENSPWPALLALAGGVLFALLGGHRSGGKTFACYQRARPFLGLAGGLIFGLIGYVFFHRIY